MLVGLVTAGGLATAAVSVGLAATSDHLPLPGLHRGAGGPQAGRWALVVVFIRDGLVGLRDIGARLIRWRVGWIWYALALAVPLTVHAATIGLNLAAGAEAPSTAPLSPWYGVVLAIGLNIVNPTGGPFGEEPSFRGFAVPAVQERRTPLVTGAILAVLIAGWHAPLIFMDSFDLSPIDAATTAAVTFWYVWLFQPGRRQRIDHPHRTLR